jgi:hypothetical protein
MNRSKVSYIIKFLSRAGDISMNITSTPALIPLSYSCYQGVEVGGSRPDELVRADYDSVGDSGVTL